MKAFAFFGPNVALHDFGFGSWLTVIHVRYIISRESNSDGTETAKAIIYLYRLVFNHRPGPRYIGEVQTVNTMNAWGEV